MLVQKVKVVQRNVTPFFFFYVLILNPWLQWDEFMMFICMRLNAVALILK